MSLRVQKSLRKSRDRERFLVVLPDQGASKKISTTSFGIKARDQSWNAYLDSFIRANDSYLKSLDIDIDFSTSLDEVQIALRANGVVGAVPLRAPDTHKIIGGIVVKPRYGWRSLGSLLSSIGWSAAPEILRCPLVPGSAQEIPPWVIAGPAIAQLEMLLRHSGPQFRERTEIRQTPRGQIQWSEYCTRQLPIGSLHLLPCRYSDLDIDEHLFQYIRWSLEKVGVSLAPFIRSDLIARRLSERIKELVQSIGFVRSVVPDHRRLTLLERRLKNEGKAIELGFEAIRWILDERGLAGSVDIDGLAWRLKMHELFEMWVENLVVQWSKRFGGRVVSSRKFDSLAPIRWERSWANSLTSLIPDVVVETSDEVIIFDAKYKGFLEEIDEVRWRSSMEELKAQHRHDLHQVLAYSTLYDAKRVTAVLAYPMRLETWERLNVTGNALLQGKISGQMRSIDLAIAGLPIEISCQETVNEISTMFDRLLS